MNFDDLRWTRVDISGFRNIRDLGGYPTRDGKRIRRRLLYRSEVLTMPGAGDSYAQWNTAQADHYQALDLHTVIDLRTKVERSKTASAWRTATGADVIELPMLDVGPEYDSQLVRDLATGVLTSATVEEMAEFYFQMFESHPEVFAEAIRLISKPERSAVLLHCTVGKDRTGTVVALVLEALGVPRDIVVRDYALTEIFLPDEVKRHVPVLEAVGVDAYAVRALFEAPADAMAGGLRKIDQAYGGTIEFLLERVGLTETDLKALREHLLEGP